MVNRGYQSEDERYIDYELSRIPNTQLEVRGPKNYEKENYFSSIGAAQTFGRFCHETYTSLLAKWTGVDGLNLGFSGAGPSFFLQRPELIELINGGRFCIVQLMSGRSVGNSRFELGTNQGTVRKRGTDEDFTFAETAYLKFLRENSEEDAIALRNEIQRAYVDEYWKLGEEIKVPTILLYFSVRKPGVVSGTKSIGRYWGAFPHFIDTDVIEKIRPAFSFYVEVVSSRGLPQTITDQSTGEQHMLWDEASFPNIKHRYHNLYYPSPQMQLDSALSLLEVSKLAADMSAPKEREITPPLERSSKSALPLEIKRPRPSFPSSVANFVSQSYSDADCILEYGSGGSTVIASEMREKTVYSVESDRKWADDLREYLRKSPKTLSMPEIIYVDIGPTQDWGFPIGLENFRKFPQYPYNVWLRPNLRPPSVILIDGRFRVACFLSAALMTEKPIRILFGDYADRKKYHWVERITRPTMLIDRMAVFDLLPGQANKRDIPALIQFSLDPS